MLKKTAIPTRYPEVAEMLLPERFCPDEQVTWRRRRLAGAGAAKGSPVGPRV